MSLKSWKQEFYPVPVSRCSKKKALEHSLLKWTGLLKSNLKKHGMMVNDLGDIFDAAGNCFDIDIKTCALCKHYADYLGGDCISCPLCKINKCCLEDDSPYGIWIDTANPRPMINALKKAIKRESEG